MPRASVGTAHRADRATRELRASGIGEATGLAGSTLPDCKNSSRSAVSKRRSRPTVLRQAARFQGLLIHGTLPPAHLVARRYYQERRLRTLSGDGAKRVAESLGTRSEPDERQKSIAGSPPSQCQ